jgi:hypothetical protein
MKWIQRGSLVATCLAMLSVMAFAGAAAQGVRVNGVGQFTFGCSYDKSTGKVQLTVTEPAHIDRVYRKTSTSTYQDMTDSDTTSAQSVFEFIDTWLQQNAEADPVQYIYYKAVMDLEGGGAVEVVFKIGTDGSVAVESTMGGTAI